MSEQKTDTDDDFTDMEWAKAFGDPPSQPIRRKTWPFVLIGFLIGVFITGFVFRAYAMPWAYSKGFSAAIEQIEEGLGITKDLP